jgi:hypothetical protein
MPNYKYGKFFGENQSDTFDQLLPPGTVTPASGIYRCETCGFEAVSTLGHPLPPTVTCPNHDRQWKCNHGLVRWRLVAAAVHVSA